jgi:hypothetical protein
MKAITVWQPWASLILIGAKPYEFRTSPYTRYVNPPKVGERIALHAAARPVRRSEVLDLIGRLEGGDPEVNPCLVRDIALPFLLRVLESVPDRRMRAKPSAPAASLFGGSPPSAAPAPAAYHCPLSAILCTAVLGEPKRGDKCAAEFGRERQGLYVPRAMGSAFNWGWPLLDIEPVMPPVEAHGSQGFWEWRGSTGAAA